MKTRYFIEGRPVQRGEMIEVRITSINNMDNSPHFRMYVHIFKGEDRPFRFKLERALSSGDLLKLVEIEQNFDKYYELCKLKEIEIL